MEHTRNCYRCEACRLAFNKSTSERPPYFRMDSGKSRTLSRSSSAGSAKTRKKGPSKNTSSDSRIARNQTTVRTSLRVSKNKEQHPQTAVDKDSVKQLKDDLSTIKQQLFELTQNRSEALQVSNELQIRYQRLLKLNEEQAREIEELKAQNNSLMGKMRELKTAEATEIDGVLEAKKNLDLYEQKLNALYAEFVDSSKMMEMTREQVCRCIEEKTQQFEELEKSKQELSKAVAEKDCRFDQLMQNYQQVKQNEKMFERRNHELANTVADLEAKLNQALEDVEQFRNDAATSKKLQTEMKDKTKCYMSQLQEKCRKISDLSCVVDELKQHVGECEKKSENSTIIEKRHEKLQVQHQKLLEQLKMFECCEDRRFKEIQAMKENEKNLVAELMKMKNYAEELSRNLNQDELLIAQLKTANQQKDSVIQCQCTKLAAKDKQIELAALAEERMKKRSSLLQEELVSMKISNCGARNVVISADECCALNLSEELQDLIDALYEEIDKAMEKDDEIQKQYRNICCLQCALSMKDKELDCLHNEMRIIREQLNRSNRENEILAMNLKRLEDEYCTLEYGEEEEVECNCDDCE